MTTINAVGLSLSGKSGSGAFAGTISPIFVTPTLGDALATSIQFSALHALLDANGNVIAGITSTASAVNYMQLFNNATNDPVGIMATGSDNNIVFELQGKGNGGATLQGSTAANDPAAGYLGEVISSAVTAQSTSANSPFNVTSIALTAGDWDVVANVTTTPASGTTTQYIQAGISTTTGSMPAAPYRNTSSAYIASTEGGISVPYQRINVSSTTTVYLVALIQYGVSTLTTNGYIAARRAR